MKSLREPREYLCLLVSKDAEAARAGTDGYTDRQTDRQTDKTMNSTEVLGGIQQQLRTYSVPR